MKKALLSTILILSFASYALYGRIIGTNIPIVPTPEPDKPKVPLSLPTYTPSPTPVATKPSPTPSPQPTPQPAPPPATTGKYRNGSFTGPVVNAYYGNVQVKAIISGGKITDVQFLDYPHDRQTSVRINSRATPLLTSEAIAAQSANVDGVSGASFTSAAFIKSLSSALLTAKI